MSRVLTSREKRKAKGGEILIKHKREKKKREPVDVERVIDDGYANTFRLPPPAAAAAVLSLLSGCCWKRNLVVPPDMHHPLWDLFIGIQMIQGLF